MKKQTLKEQVSHIKSMMGLNEDRNKVITCDRCGEILTAPVFINGKPYGWSCAIDVKKEMGLGLDKKEKQSGKWVEVDSFEIIENTTEDKVFVAKVNFTNMLNEPKKLTLQFATTLGGDVRARFGSNRTCAIYSKNDDKMYININPKSYMEDFKLSNGKLGAPILRSNMIKIFGDIK
jgi:hypothetical protein